MTDYAIQNLRNTLYDRERERERKRNFRLIILLFALLDVVLIANEVIRCS